MSMNKAQNTGAIPKIKKAQKAVSPTTKPIGTITGEDIFKFPTNVTQTHVFDSVPLGVETVGNTTILSDPIKCNGIFFKDLEDFFLTQKSMYGLKEEEFFGTKKMSSIADAADIARITQLIVDRATKQVREAELNKLTLAISGMHRFMDEINRNSTESTNATNEIRQLFKDQRTEVKPMPVVVGTEDTNTKKIVLGFINLISHLKVAFRGKYQSFFPGLMSKAKEDTQKLTQWVQQVDETVELEDLIASAYELQKAYGFEPKKK